MKRRNLVTALRRLNRMSALALAGVSFGLFLAKGALAPVVLLLGLLIVGPVEDWLLARFASAPQPLRDTVLELVDQLTSLALILSLIAACLLCA